MRVVMALGGNALLRRGETPDTETQRRNVRRAIEQAVAPIARRHEVVITHRNGPQIGLLALQAAALLAEQIGVERLLILTDVPAVWTRWPMTEGTLIGSATPKQLRAKPVAQGANCPRHGSLAARSRRSNFSGCKCDAVS